MRLVFMGTPQAAVPTLDRCLADKHDVVAVYTQPDRPSGRGNKITASPVKEFALSCQLPIFQPEKIKTAEAIEHFRSHAADLAVVVAYGRILPPDFLRAFPLGAINVHFSLLPKYRGAAPVNWAIANGETMTGVTTMKMDEGLDTGDILIQRRTPIGDRENAFQLVNRLSLTGADLLTETLDRINEIHPEPQDHTSATFAPILKKSDGLIEWEMSAKRIADRVRGFQPFPTSFTYFGDTKLTVWEARAEPDQSDAQHPAGTIIAAKDGILNVQCGLGSVLSVHELQPEGKRRMSVRDFLNGAKISEGDCLGKQP